MKRLIIGPAWVGDMVMAQALARRLKRLYPADEIHIVAPAATLPLTQRMPEITRGHLLDVRHNKLDLARRWQLARHLRGQNFSGALVLPSSFKSALVPFLAGIPVRKGTLRELRYGLINQAHRHKSPAGRTVDEFVSFAGAGPMLADEAPQLMAGAEADGLLTQLHAAGVTRFVALCPGAEYGPAKRWPAGHFARLAALLGRQGMASLLIGGPKDREISATIRAQAGEAPVHDLTGKTNLLQAIDLLAQAEAVVSNDSGLMHVAAALKRPLVALYGSSSSERTPPLSAKARILSVDIACRPCFKRVCPLGHLDCLVKLEVDRVAEAVLAQLATIT